MIQGSSSKVRLSQSVYRASLNPFCCTEQIHKGVYTTFKINSLITPVIHSYLVVVIVVIVVIVVSSRRHHKDVNELMNSG